MGLNEDRLVASPPADTVEAPFDRLSIPELTADGYGRGVCRRRIRLQTVDDTLVVGELEDDFHHFRAELTHDSERIIAVRGVPMRGPWSTCMDVGEPLRAIEGQPLAGRSTAIGAYAEATANCTHLFDLTGLAVAHAVRGEEERQYDFAITDVLDGHHELAAWRNGEEVLHWHVVDGEITGPEDWVGAPLAAKFIPWAQECLDIDTAEAAIALRRMLHITIGRSANLDHVQTAAEHTDGPVGRCYSYRSETAVMALRSNGSIRDFQAPEHARLRLADMHLREPGADNPTDLSR